VNPKNPVQNFFFGQTFTLNQSHLSNESPPLNFEYSSDSIFDFSSFFASFEEEIMSTLNFNLALKLIPAFDGSAGALLIFIEMTHSFHNGHYAARQFTIALPYLFKIRRTSLRIFTGSRVRGLAGKKSSHQQKRWRNYRKT
jgi:hypothetical protein